jgi:Domain of unknown function (DUF5069)
MQAVEREGAHMEEIVPLISSSVTGPLGAAHLPRLWLKILLHACGRLPEGYRHGQGGFDELTCVNLGLDRDAFVAYIENEKPDYLQLESWVRAHGTKVDPGSIAAHNEQVLNFRMGEQMAAERRARFGITDDTFANGVMLNNLDDWAGVHTLVTGEAVGRAPA